MCKLLRMLCYWSKINRAQNSIANLTFSIDYTKLQRLFRHKKNQHLKPRPLLPGEHINQLSFQVLVW